MLRQASCSGTVPGHHGIWSAQKLDAEWLARATEAAGGEWPEWPSELAGAFGIGSGFAAGGLLDGLTPGPELAGFAENAWADGLGTLSDDALVGVLRAWRRLASWAAAGEIAAVAELDRRRWAEVAAGADPHLAEHVGDELAASLTLTGRGRRRQHRGGRHRLLLCAGGHRAMAGCAWWRPSRVSSTEYQ